MKLEDEHEDIMKLGDAQEDLMTVGPVKEGIMTLGDMQEGMVQLGTVLDTGLLHCELNGSLAGEEVVEVVFPYQAEQLAFLWVLLGVIVLGNSLVLASLLHSRARKSRMNFFIAHLAAADLSVGLLSVLVDIGWKLAVSWEAGLTACRAIKFCQLLVTYGSTYVLVALSIDRYDAITHPMNFSGSWKRARWLVLAAWVTAAAFSVPILWFFSLHETEQFGTQCWIDFPQPWHWKLYMTLVAISLFFLPTLIIASCYTVIVATVWNKGRAMAAPTCTPALLPRVPLTEARMRRIALEDPEGRRASSRGLIPKAKVKTVKMTCVIILVFVLCWSPYIMFDLLQVYGLIPQNQTSQAVATFIQSLAPLNSAANPLIYCLFSADLGRCLRLPSCPCCSTEEASSTSSSSGQTNSSSLLSSSITSRGRGRPPPLSAATIAVQRF